MNSRSNILWILALLIGCGNVTPALPPDGGTDSGTSDSGTDGGIDGGMPDGGMDGGMPDGGTCVNDIVQVPYIYPDDCRTHICFDYDTCAETPTPYIHNPPIAGPHYWVWAKWGIHDETPPLPRGYWVHNLEHGAVVFLYRPDAPQSLKDALRRVFAAIPLMPPTEWPACCAGTTGTPCDNHKRVLLTPDPMLDTPWAVTVSGPEEFYCVGYGYYIKGDCIASEQALVDFALQHRSMGAEPYCDEGFVP
jgi:hypothetical protein